MEFYKMHGLGNDVIILDLIKNPMEITPHLARQLCDRRFGIGADQIMTVASSQSYDYKSSIINADGTEAEMCGNGIRCVARYLAEHCQAPSQITFETLAGPIKTELVGQHLVQVDMGTPQTRGKDWEGENIAQAIEVVDQTFAITTISMGNPHCVIFLPENINLTEFDLAKYGQFLENHSFFPNRINVEFVQKNSAEELTMRVWERGAGETMACGTGACAVGAAAVLNEVSERKVLVHLNGGDLQIEWDENTGHILMTGPAIEVFKGQLSLEIE